jgi:hypothetical protein
MNRLEIVINEIDKDIHREVNPQYLQKLEKIKKQKGVCLNVKTKLTKRGSSLKNAGMEQKVYFVK